MGRAALPKPVSKYRRQILRTIRGDANANTDLNTYSYGDGYSNCYAGHHTHRYTKGKSDAED
jgi:hypothetical protein